MPVYAFQAPDGKRYKVEAPTPEAAHEGFIQTVTSSPGMFSSPGVRAALKDVGKLNRGRGDLDALTQRLSDAASLGLSTQFNAGLGAAGTALRNHIPGLHADYSAKDYYDAWRLNEAAQRAETQAQHPVLSTATDVVGALATPGSEAVGKFIVGKAAPAARAAGENVKLLTRAAQTARASAVGALQSGAQGAALAKPGEEAQDAERGAAIGAVAAPALGGVLSLGGKALPAVARTVQRVVGPYVAKLPVGRLPMLGGDEPILGDAARRALQAPDAGVTSAAKLGDVLRREGLRPEAVQKALETWTSAGGVTPALIDILKEAGAAPGVLRLLQRSGAQAPARVAAEQYGEQTVGGVQGAALAEAAKLKTGEPRTPSQIRADLDARRAAIDTELAAKRQAPPPGAPRDSGAAAFAQDLNGKYDASRKVYEEAYHDAERARPESAVVPDAERAPIVTRVLSELGPVNRFSKDSQDVVRLVSRLREGELPPPTPEEIAAGVQESPRGTHPLTVLDLHHMRQTLGEMGGRLEGNAQRQALVARDTLDAELQRLAEENKIEGDDPDVVDKWRQAILGFAQHKQVFGDGLAAKLTERVPGKPAETVVKPYQAGDVIFGDKASGVRPLNAVLGDLEPVMGTVEPGAAQALQAELYGRIPPGELPGLLERYPTAAPRLLPEHLLQGSLAAQQATAEAEAAAAAQHAALDAGPARALETGRQALATPSETYAPMAQGVDDADLPVMASGAKQSVVDLLESPDPASTARLRRLTSAQATHNLGLTLGDEQVGGLQTRLGLLEKQARNAQALELATGASGPHESPLVETVSAGDLAYPRRGIADAALQLLRHGSRLSPQEYEATVRRLTAAAPGALDEVLAHLTEKYAGTAAKRAASPYLARTLSDQPGDDDALARLRQEYGLDF